MTIERLRAVSDVTGPFSSLAFTRPYTFNLTVHTMGKLEKAIYFMCQNFSSKVDWVNRLEEVIQPRQPCAHQNRDQRDQGRGGQSAAPRGGKDKETFQKIDGFLKFTTISRMIRQKLVYYLVSFNKILIFELSKILLPVNRIQIHCFTP